MKKRKIIAKGMQGSMREVVPITYYFPEVDVDITNVSTLDRSGYRPCLTCDVCKLKGEGASIVEVDQTYAEIILCLKAQGLLPEGYPMMCCGCYSYYKKREDLKYQKSGNR